MVRSFARTQIRHGRWSDPVLQRVLLVFQRVARLRGRESALPAHLQTGLDGEMAAFFELRRRGLVVVARRWRDGAVPGDIDLIAWDGGTLCFVEVKTRTSREIATASSAVGHHKRRTFRRLARRYLQHLESAQGGSRQPEVRFDIVTVYDLPGVPREINVIPAAFGWSEHS